MWLVLLPKPWTFGISPLDLLPFRFQPVHHHLFLFIF
jgi:hypothetical protein